MPRTFVLLLCLLPLLPVARRHVGFFPSPPAGVPFIQLPRNNPMLGNGHLGTLLDASSLPRNRTAAGPGDANTLDMWHTTTSFWSCTDSCGALDPYHTVPSCCSAVALGGLSLRLGALGAALNFSAVQDLDAAALTTHWVSDAGGAVVRTVTIQHPTADVVETNVTYTAGDVGPPTLTVRVAVWVIGHIHTSPAQWSSGTPIPWRAGCADGSGSEVSCNSSSATLAFVSRNASSYNAITMPITAALAAGVRLGPGAALLGLEVTSAPLGPPGDPWEVELLVTVPSTSWFVVTVAEAEARGRGLVDPVSDALVALAGALASPPDTTADAVAVWWADFWAASTVSFPGAPALEDAWYGMQYVTAAASSPSGLWPAPGLYGPWLTADSGRWHGDYTLDFNMNSFFYGVYSSNHGEHAASLWAPVIDQAAGPALVRARAEATKAHANCSADALFFPCHMAPWGQGSLDPMMNFMTWNGPFASLLFINAFEYGRDADFAANVTLPLLAGMNAWWACYLVKTPTGPGPDDYVWADTNPYRKDMQAENQAVPNPQLGLSFLRRTVSAQKDIAATLGIPLSPDVAELAAHLPPLNTATFQVPLPSSIPWNVSAGMRCEGGNATYFAVSDPSACEAICAASPGCAALVHTAAGTGICYTLWTPAEPSACVPAGAWTYAVKEAAPPDSPLVNATVWASYGNAPLEKSDWNAAGGLWPTESIEPPDTPGADPALSAVAGLSNLLFINFPGAANNGAPRACDIFTLVARAGLMPPNASLPGFTPAALLAGLLDWARVAVGPGNLFAWAEGGLENTGVARAINEMLVRSVRLPDDGGGAPAWAIRLFPFWPVEQAATFSGLLVKGGFAVGATFDNSTASVVSPVTVTAQHVWGGAPAARAALFCSWGAQGAVVTCGGTAAANVQWDGDLLSWDAPAAVACQVMRTT
jgi:hypothetical protein